MRDTGTRVLAIRPASASLIGCEGGPRGPGDIRAGLAAVAAPIDAVERVAP